MADKYAPNEKVFAKLKGFPPWPAKIMQRAAGKEEKYRIVFYGTHDESTVKLDLIFKYNETTKAKYGKPQRKAHFNEALAEIEDDNGEGGEIIPESLSESNEEEKIPVESEGELMIDEGPPSLPPVLTREVDKVVATPETPDIKGNKSKRPRTLSKRDSLTGPATPPAIVENSATTPDGQPGVEMVVSRSGRKIKPKRFADDEITPPIIAVGKLGKSGEDGQPARKTKRSTSLKSSTPTSTMNKASAEDSPKDESEQLSTSSKSKPFKGKSTRQDSRLSPDISEPLESKGPPTLKLISKRRSSGNKQIPSLEPNPLKAVTTRKSERNTRSNSTEENQDEESTDTPLATNVAEVDENEIDKENSNTTSVEEASNANALTDDQIFLKPREPVRHVPAPPPERKIRVATKTGLKIELSFDMKNPEGKGEADNKNWQTIANQNVRKVIEDLREGDVESQELINSTAEAALPRVMIIEDPSRDILASQLKMLRLEGEVIEIIGEIVGCLSVHSADCVRAMDLLDRLEEHKLNPLMLKKHPEVVHTIQRLRCYVGNVDVWQGYEEPAYKVEFATYAEEIRRKSASIFKHFQELFGAESADAFILLFQEEVKQFKLKIEGFPLKRMLGLTEENGELRELDIEINGEAEVEDMDVE